MALHLRDYNRSCGMKSGKGLSLRGIADSKMRVPAPPAIGVVTGKMRVPQNGRRTGPRRESTSGKLEFIDTLKCALLRLSIAVGGSGGLHETKD